MPSSTKKTYAEDFKQSSAKLAVESDHPISKTAQSLGVKDTTLHGWINKYYPDYKRSQQTELSSSEQEIRELRKELAQVKQERDILKKAAAYFANETL